MAVQSSPPDRERVRAALARVTDPELDESIVELGYVDGIDVERADDGADLGTEGTADAATGPEADGRTDPTDSSTEERTDPAAALASRVTVRFTLPTAWCSPAFAWMMATDAREAVEGLDGVAAARIVLRDHMHDEQITRGVNEGLSFEAAFPDADGGVAATRAKLDEKARLARQHEAVGTLLDAGLDPAQIVELTPADVEFGAEEEEDGPAPSADVGSDGAPAPDPRDEGTAVVYVRDRALGVVVPAEPLDRYRRKAREVGFATDPDQPLFRDPDGDPIDPEAFELVRRRTRLAGVNMGGQGGVCDALNEARRERRTR